MFYSFQTKGTVYKTLIISTIVDRGLQLLPFFVYKTLIISTIVDVLIRRGEVWVSIRHL